MPYQTPYPMISLMYGYIPEELWADYHQEDYLKESQSSDRQESTELGKPSPNWSTVVATALLLMSGLAVITQENRMMTALSDQASKIASEIGAMN